LPELLFPEVVPPVDGGDVGCGGIVGTAVGRGVGVGLHIPAFDERACV